MLSSSLIELDRQHLVHPVISWREHEDRGAMVLESAHGWLKAMHEACRNLGILFIADEVITGFGRTGSMFACER